MDPAISNRLSDWNNETCLRLGETAHYTVDVSSGRWFPETRNKCHLPGLLITKCVPDDLRTPFNVRIIGHHLVCSTSYFNVAVRQTKWSTCHLAGVNINCNWNDVIVSGGLTTCVATCVCEGDDCRHVIVYIPKKYDEWKMCEIEFD